ncbi:MAG: hypothetical protein KKI09_13965 [Spirochaetes bacterium]|nr:hypothetical protein [Spirochaetota bacterium]MBU0956532.1 hypothetical protein [Spirochaetota bacterium]
MKKILVLLGAFGLLLTACTNPVMVDVEFEETLPAKTEITRDPLRLIDLSSPDAYENDDTQSLAKSIAASGNPQEHNFYDDATDWLYFQATVGKTYEIETWVIGSADTIVSVYDGYTRKVYNDDKASGDYGSKLTFTPTVSKTYTVKVYSYNGRKGTNRGYSIAVSDTAGGGGGGGIVLPQPQKQWTVLVYLDADNNLSSYGTKDIEEMKLAGSNAGLNIVVLWDNMSNNHGYYYIEQGSATLLTDIGEPNMGNPQTAKTFISYAAENFPADKYMFVYWNHGGAVDRGIAWDDSNGEDHLSEVEQLDLMNYGVQVLGKPFEAVGFDACLMATAEIYYQYRDVAKYIAASEQTEPGDGWDWKWLSVLRNNPAADGAVATKAIFDYYKAWYSNQSDVTFSTVDMAYADELGSALDSFARAAINSGVAGSTYRTLASALPNFTGYTKDLVAYLDKILASSSVPQTVKTSAQALRTLCTGQLVLQNWTGSTWTGKAYGTSITLKSDTAIYRQLDLCVDTQWNEFLTFAGFANAY